MSLPADELKGNHLHDILDQLRKILIPVVFWLIIWWLLSILVGNRLLIPGPGAVLDEFLTLARDVTFWKSALFSLLRIFSGAAIGIAAGCVLAMLTASFRLADTLLSPAIRTVRAVPVASFIILLLLWVHRNFVPVVVSALVVFPIIWGNVSAGIANVPSDLLEFGRVYQLSRLRIWRYVRLPFIIPHLSSGICSGVGFAWKSGVAAEVLSLPHFAIGTEIYNSKIYLETYSLFAWTIVVILLSAVLETLIRVLLRAETLK